MVLSKWSRSSTGPTPRQTMLDPSSYTLTSSGSSNPSPYTSQSVWVQDSRWRFMDESLLPKPREFHRKPRRYRAGRGSSQPLDFDGLSGTIRKEERRSAHEAEGDHRISSRSKDGNATKSKSRYSHSLHLQDDKERSEHTSQNFSHYHEPKEGENREQEQPRSRDMNGKKAEEQQQPYKQRSHRSSRRLHRSETDRQRQIPHPETLSPPVAAAVGEAPPRKKFFELRNYVDVFQDGQQIRDLGERSQEPVERSREPSKQGMNEDEVRRLRREERRRVKEEENKPATIREAFKRLFT